MVPTTETLRELRPGQRLTRLGVLVACEPSNRGPIAGLAVRVRGRALEGGLVALTRARARPFSARLSPWEGAGWEHSLALDGDAKGAACVLRAASVGVRGQGQGALARAVYVELEGRALREGCGELELVVEPIGPRSSGRVEARYALRVRAEQPREVLSAYLAWPGPLQGERAKTVGDVLRAFGRVVGALPAGPRVMAARGTAREQLWLREGCVVLGGRGALAGDARWKGLWARAMRGALEQLVLRSPGGDAHAEQALELSLCHRARFGAGTVELALSIGRGRLGEADRVAEALVRAVRGGHGAVHGFVAEHDWGPSLLDHTPWERRAGVEPARTLAALTGQGRVDAREALWALGASLEVARERQPGG